MKALKFYKELKESEPSTSSRESEVASADEEAARKYPEKLAKIIKDGEYCAHQVFNADETGLFWKKMPTRTYIAKSEKTASGFKAAKDRVTLLLCSNASGDRMLKPLLVNRSLKPRALKGKDLNTLPVHWMANKKAWVTTAIFTEWFNKCFVPEVENYMNEMGLEFKILLILDNAPAIAEIKSQTLNACWKAAWPECVSKGNESNRAIVTSEIISIAKEIGGEGFDDFGEHDIEELLVDEALNDDDILESMVDITKDLETVDSEPEEDVTPLDEKLLREGLQLSGKLANFFIQNDNDVERALKFQRDLKFCMSGYRELYKELVPSQSLITDYLVKEKKITEVPEEALPCRSDDVILSSSDESDLAPIHKRVRTLSDSE
ncbi:tigger transposable element-derived protein 1 [Trichonephila clavipes]|nr:tigger transposable element-derived protein 1 [Trichonephila clavipes]